MTLPVSSPHNSGSHVVATRIWPAKRGLERRALQQHSQHSKCGDSQRQAVRLHGVAVCANHGDGRVKAGQGSAGQGRVGQGGNAWLCQAGSRGLKKRSSSRQHAQTQMRTPAEVIRSRLGSRNCTNFIRTRLSGRQERGGGRDRVKIRCFVVTTGHKGVLCARQLCRRRRWRSGIRR